MRRVRWFQSVTKEPSPSRCLASKVPGTETLSIISQRIKRIGRSELEDHFIPVDLHIARKHNHSRLCHDLIARHCRELVAAVQHERCLRSCTGLAKNAECVAGEPCAELTPLTRADILIVDGHSRLWVFRYGQITNGGLLARRVSIRLRTSRVGMGRTRVSACRRDGNGL
jgi:hypothetical protein